MDETKIYEIDSVTLDWNWHGLEEIGTLHEICDFG